MNFNSILFEDLNDMYTNLLMSLVRPLAEKVRYFKISRTLFQDLNDMYPQQRIKNFVKLSTAIKGAVDSCSFYFAKVLVNFSVLVRAL